RPPSGESATGDRLGRPPGGTERGRPRPPELRQGRSQAARSLFGPSKLCVSRKRARTLLDTWRKHGRAASLRKNCRRGAERFRADEARSFAAGLATQRGEQETAARAGNEDMKSQRTRQ